MACCIACIGSPSKSALRCSTSSKSSMDRELHLIFLGSADRTQRMELVFKRMTHAECVRGRAWSVRPTAASEIAKFPLRHAQGAK